MYSMRNVLRIHGSLLCSIPPINARPLSYNPKIARRALEKQRADELEYAQLLEDNVPAAPIYSELDGGMNKVFLARFPDRVTLSKRPGLVRWCTPTSSSTALDRTDGDVRRMHLTCRNCRRSRRSTLPCLPRAAPTSDRVELHIAARA